MFKSVAKKIAASLYEFWCKREHVECDALKEWKLNIFKIIDRRISFYSRNTYMLPCKSKISYRYQGFHRKYVLVPADKAANNIVVTRLLYINTLKQELSGTKAYEHTSEKESVINNNIFHNFAKFAVIKRGFLHSVGYLNCTNNHIRHNFLLILAHA